MTYYGETHQGNLYDIFPDNKRVEENEVTFP